jgi:hypothetical protein
LTKKAITVLGTISLMVFLTVPKYDVIRFLIMVVSMFALGELCPGSLSEALLNCTILGM